MTGKTDIKSKLSEKLFDNLSNIDGVLSITLVGSFVDQVGLGGISDIDIVVVCLSLSKSIFEACLEATKNIDLNSCGLTNYTLQVNPTFGPLKFDEPGLAVIHLMVYDLQGHRKHVLASPFTCLDWERSEIYQGKSLKELFPVGSLQYRDFLEVRRSLDNYLDDLDKKVISYREYNFEGNQAEEIKKNKTT